MGFSGEYKRFIILERGNLQEGTSVRDQKIRRSQVRHGEIEMPSVVIETFTIPDKLTSTSYLQPARDGK